MAAPEVLHVPWPMPPWVRAAVTTRKGGISAPPFDFNNLAAHVGDREGAVKANRESLRQALHLKREPAWLEQVHGSTVVRADTVGEIAPQADASVTSVAGVACTVLVADCVPVLLCDRVGARVGAAHAGWRGMSAGVIEATVQALGVSPASLVAWLGPAIGPEHYEVGDEVREAFVGPFPETAKAFGVSGPGKWRANLFGLALHRLRRAGVVRVLGGGVSTFSDPAHFFSYRRDGRTGRMAAMIWITDAP